MIFYKLRFIEYVFVLLLCGFVLCLCSNVAYAFTTDWKENEYSKVRVRVVDVKEDKIVSVIEMMLNDGWYTYYKDPGDFGLPTDLQFSSCDKTEIYWTKYETINNKYLDNVLTSNIYRNTMVLPVELFCSSKNISLKIRYAVCNGICIPLSMQINFDVSRQVGFDEENSEFLERHRELIMLK